MPKFKCQNIFLNVCNLNFVPPLLCKFNTEKAGSRFGGENLISHCYALCHNFDFVAKHVGHGHNTYNLLS